MFSIMSLRGVARQSAIPPLAFLVFRNAFQQMCAAELRPQRGRHINLRIGQLPKKKVAQPHFTTGAHHEIGIG